MPDDPFTHPSLQALRDYVGMFENKRQGWESDNLPAPPLSPPDFYPRPFVTGSPEFARKVENVLDLMPAARRSVKSVFQGHGPMFTEYIQERGRPDLIGNMLNVQGLEFGGDIEVDTYPAKEAGVIAHELGHTLDMNEGEAQDIYMLDEHDDPPLYNELPEELQLRGR